MHKMVDGVSVEMTEGEIAERLAEEAEWEAKASDRAFKQLRVDRDILLMQTDASVTIDRWTAMSAEIQAAWTTYRQALRDLPANTTDPLNPIWPLKPEA